MTSRNCRDFPTGVVVSAMSGVNLIDPETTDSPINAINDLTCFLFPQLTNQPIDMSVSVHYVGAVIGKQQPRLRCLDFSNLTRTNWRDYLNSVESLVGKTIPVRQMPQILLFWHNQLQ